MAKDGFHWDTRQYVNAIIQYARESEKTYAEAVDRQTANLAFKTHGSLPRAKAGIIRALQAQPWWPKYISKIMHSAGPYDSDDAKAASKRIIRNRMRSVAYMRSGLVDILRKFGKHRSGRLSRNVKTRTATATPRNVKSSFTALYKARSGRDKLEKDRILDRAMKSAIPKTIKDMIKYTERKMREAAKEHSGKAA